MFIQFSLPTVFQKQETVRQTLLVPTSAESGNPPQWLKESAQDVLGRRAWVRLQVSRHVVRTQGIRRALCCPQRWRVLRRAQGKYLPPTGHTSSSQVLFSSFLSQTVSNKIWPIIHTFVPHSSQCGVSLKFWCLGRNPANATVEFSNPCQRWSSLIFLLERKKTLL